MITKKSISNFHFQQKSELSNFYENGFFVFDIGNLKPLISLRKKVINHIVETFNLENNDEDESFLNKFHCRGLPESEINKIRLSLVNDLSVKEKFNREIAEMIAPQLKELIGPDILSQRKANFSIQSPNEENIIPVHSDAPANSQFEVVIWIPLVDAYETKAMFIANKKDSQNATRKLKNPNTGYNDYTNSALEKAEHHTIKFGQVLAFQTSNVHGCKINVEEETRWSINIRYKGLFHPFGAKNPFEFFELICTSPFGEQALEKIQKRHQ